MQANMPVHHIPLQDRQLEHRVLRSGAALRSNDLSGRGDRWNLRGRARTHSQQRFVGVYIEFDGVIYLQNMGVRGGTEHLRVYLSLRANVNGI